MVRSANAYFSDCITSGSNKEGRNRAMKVMLKMVKLDINKIKDAYMGR